MILATGVSTTVAVITVKSLAKLPRFRLKVLEGELTTDENGKED